jgi:hypothetical protein
MAQFLTTHGTAFQIENIVAGAKRRLVLVTPYLKISRTLYERLRDAAGRGVRTTLVYGKSALSADDEEALSELRGLSLYYSENLHAKCYFNEDQMVITSMNLHEFSEKNNREMGVLVTSAEEVYTAAVAEVQSILAAADSQPLARRGHLVGEARPIMPQRPARAVSRARAYGSRGHAFCIRCARSIPYDPEMPYCDRCAEVWSAFENPDYQERVCHSCGRETRSSMAKPLCYSCYREEYAS